MLSNESYTYCVSMLFEVAEITVSKIDRRQKFPRVCDLSKIISSNFKELQQHKLHTSFRYFDNDNKLTCFNLQ